MKGIRVVKTLTRNRSSGRISLKKKHNNPPNINLPQINLLPLNKKGSLLRKIIKRVTIPTRKRRKLVLIVRRMDMKNIIARTNRLMNYST